jgi:hypothetical protein
MGWGTLERELSTLVDPECDADEIFPPHKRKVAGLRLHLVESGGTVAGPAGPQDGHGDGIRGVDSGGNGCWMIRKNRHGSFDSGACHAFQNRTYQAVVEHFDALDL